MNFFNSQLDNIKNDNLFFSGTDAASIQNAIMNNIVTVVIALFNLIIVARIIYLFIQRMTSGDDTGQIKNQIKNCVIAAIVINVVCSIPFIASLTSYYLGYSFGG